MLLIPMPNISENNVSTSIHYEIELVNEIATTRLRTDSFENNKILDYTSYLKKNPNSIQIEVNEIYNDNSATWTEFIDDNFDIISKLVFKKSFKIKSKIVSISKFTPNIIIE